MHIDGAHGRFAKPLAAGAWISFPCVVGEGGVGMAGQAGFFDLDERYAGLSASGDPLERLSRVVDFEVFREELERAVRRSERRRGGRPPMDAGDDVQGAGAAGALGHGGRAGRTEEQTSELPSLMRRTYA